MAYSLTVSKPYSAYIVQRVGTVGTLQFVGSYDTDANGHLEVSWKGGGFVDLVATTIGGGSFNTTLSGQAQGQGSVIVRIKENPATSVTVTFVGIGDIFPIYGDSTGSMIGNSHDRSVGGMQWSQWSENNFQWRNGPATYDQGWDGDFAVEWMAAAGVPVGIINGSVSGADLPISWDPGAVDPTEPSSRYARLLRLAGDYGGSFRAAFGTLGANNATDGIASRASYTAALGRLAAGFAALPGAPPTFTGIFNGVNGGTRTNEDDIRAATMASIGVAMLPGMHETGETYGDGTHPSTLTHGREIGGRWYIALNNYFNGGTDGRGPRIDRVTMPSSSTVLVRFDRALGNSVSSDTTGFRVTDDGVAATIITQVVQSTTMVLLTLSAPTAGTVLVSFASGRDAYGSAIIPQTPAVAMPSDGVTINLPAEFALDFPITAASPAIPWRSV